MSARGAHFPLACTAPFIPATPETPPHAAPASSCQGTKAPLFIFGVLLEFLRVDLRIFRGFEGLTRAH